MIKRRKIKRYGWTPDFPDNRDLVYETRKMGHILPEVVDLRPKCPPVQDQSNLGACTAHAICSAFQFEQMRQGVESWQPSRLMVYFNERDMEGTVDFDSGAQLRDGIKSIASLGVCPETDWPYDISKFTDRPHECAYKTALDHQALSYRRIGFIKNSMIDCLAQGLPFVFGFTCYESFESQEVTNTGMVPMPKENESVAGGHAVLCVGYNQPKKLFCFMNSYGTGWGENGFGWLPFDYLTNPNLADDRWQVSKVEG